MRLRADKALVERGLLETRAKARAAIEARRVRVNGRVIERPSDLVGAEDEVSAEAEHPYVSRAGLKLAAALDAFDVSPAGLVCLDVGASTGGFTDVLLRRGAARVYAVDVGHGQLHPSLGRDPRVIAREGLDARALEPSLFEAPPSLVAMDVSFISLMKAAPAPLRLAAPRADLVALVKPQFEAGPGRVGKGGLLDPDLAETVARETAVRLDGLSGFRVMGLIPSPILGGGGAREFLLHARRGPQ